MENDHYMAVLYIFRINQVQVITSELLCLAYIFKAYILENVPDTKARILLPGTICSKYIQNCHIMIIRAFHFCTDLNFLQVFGANHMPLAVDNKRMSFFSINNCFLFAH